MASTSIGLAQSAARAQSGDDASIAGLERQRSTSDGAAPRPGPPLTPFNISLLHPVALYPDAQLRRIAVELAFLYGVTGSTAGVAIGGVALWTPGDVAGLMLSPVNVVEQKVDGVQLGLVNVADRVSGLQLGLVNVAERGNGVQIGLVNVGETGRYHIGLLNLPPSLRVSALVWASGLPMLVSAGARFASTRSPVYTVLALGYGHDDTHGFVAPAYALGLRFAPQRWLFDVDVSYQPELATANRARHVIALRASAGIRIVDQLAFFLGAGPALEIAHARKPNVAARAFSGVELLF